MIFQGRAILKTSKGIEHLRNAIVCEHGDLVDVVEGTVAFALKACP